MVPHDPADGTIIAMTGRLTSAWSSGVTGYLFAVAISSYDGVLSMVIQTPIGAFISGIALLFLAPFAAILRNTIVQRAFEPCFPRVLLVAFGFYLIWLSDDDRFARIDIDGQTGESFRILHLGFALPGLASAMLGPLLSPPRDGKPQP
jgi:hypothetical protein